MRFLVDSCVNRAIAEALRRNGHDVAEVSRRGPDPGDDAILASAVAEERVILTADKDLPEIVYRRRREHRGVIRIPMLPAPLVLVRLHDLLTRYSADEIGSSIITLTGARLRVARPLRPVG